jgi:hypothetical protein
MKRFLACLIVLFSLLAKSKAQSTSKALSLGGISTTLSEKDNLFLNPAGLASLNNIEVLAVTEQYYLLDGINKSGVGVVLPLGFGAFGLTASNFGFSEFRQQKLGLTYARKLMDKISIGAQFNYFQTRIPEYGSAGKISFEIGLQANLTKDIVVGTYILNPQQNENTSGAELPTLLRTGISYQVSKKIMTALELEKDIDFPLRIKYGIEYKLKEKFILRTGFSSRPANFHLGFGIQFSDHLTIDIGNKYDQTLGLTPAASVGYSF